MMTLILLISKTMMSMIISLVMAVYINLMYKNPTIMLIYLIFYSIYLAMALFMSNSLNSLLIMMTLIVFLSGMLIMFSYFVSLMNEPLKLKANLIYSIFTIFILSFKLSDYMTKDSKLCEMSIKNMDIGNLYEEMNCMLFLMMIFMLILTLFLMTKMTYIEKKTLRKKK
uniref:NADH dehydrogenase subunit 6 n=1 Tax=Apis nigrocincta TaxID=83312 RepID=A0A2Z5SHV7_9HYME|nr:NADH dehydrogenase subunit 6 [Apis nigrocincta]BBA74588.1 NADH dehydrogenase subunit 6 [Apis nigrocincta]BBA74601.1 NADH dehydrogenase subunit 6 [Apis nigrocincta]